jgi:hypothetical protein
MGDIHRNKGFWLNLFEAGRMEDFAEKNIRLAAPMPAIGLPYSTLSALSTSADTPRG